MQGKIVIVTGASSGIGRALVYEFAKRGAKVVMAARNAEELSRIEQDLSKQGVESLPVQTEHLSPRFHSRMPRKCQVR